MRVLPTVTVVRVSFLVLLAASAGSTAPAAFADDILVVVPNSKENTVGTGNIVPFSYPPARYQQLNFATEFGAITAPSLITEIAFRAGFTANPFSHTVADLQINLSTAAVTPLSGSYAASALYSLEGYKLWVEQANKRGGLLGRPVKLIYYDDKSDANTGVQLYEKLITADKVDLIVGPYSSAVTSAVSTVAEKHKMAMLGPEAADVKIYSRGYKYNFQGQTQAGKYMLGGLVLAKANGYKTLAMLAEDTAFPKAVSEEVAKVAGAYGLSVVFNETYSKGASDFSALLTKVKQLKPDVIFANSYLPDF